MNYQENSINKMKFIKNPKTKNSKNIDNNCL